MSGVHSVISPRGKRLKEMLKEEDIRPADLLERYQELILRDAQKMDPRLFVEIDCPGCRGKSLSPKFTKNAFHYVQCQSCGCVFCSPRPCQQILNEFYERSASSDYWANVFFPALMESRREKLFRSKADRIGKLLADRRTSEDIEICDAGAGYGIFLEELRRVFPSASLHAIEINPELAARCREKGFQTLETYAESSEQWANRFDLVISSEVIEHVFSPERFVQSLFNLTKPGGAVIVTGLGYEGFDILVLQEKSKNVFPPQHINFISIEGFQLLFRRVGFSQVEVWTPGELDVDIVLNSGFAPEFLQVMAKRDSALEELQKLFSAHQLSSHVWVMAVRNSRESSVHASHSE